MAQPKEVTSVTVNDGVVFKRTGGTEQVRTVQYFVGDHGPFFYTKPVSEFSAENVQRAMEDTVRQLRSIGALPAGG
jgi:hypothetical protein